MTSVTQLEQLTREAIAAIERALANGCYRLRQIQIAGEVSLDNGSVVVQTITNTPIEDSVTTITEDKSIQSGETTDEMTVTTVNGGDKIHGSTTTVTDE